MAKFCHKCGTQAIDDESVFCTKCGTQYIQNIPEKKDDVCPNYGTKIVGKESDFGIRVHERESCSIRSDGNGKRKIDYNQLIKDAVAQLPQEALHVPHIGILEPICPYCQTSLKKMPGSKTICKSCGNPIYVTKRPSDNKKALLTDAQMPLLNKLDGHKYRLAKLSEYVRDFKRDLNSYQDLGLTQWKFLGCQDAGADPIERELDGKIVEMGSEEEREMLKYLCDPRYRFCPLAVINVPKR